MSEGKKENRGKGELKGWLVAIGIVACVVGLPFLSLYIYSGIWPPMMVVSSGSMTHEDGPFGHIGSIETGDIVIPRKIGFDEIVTWEVGNKTGYKTYGDFGDVIIYYKRGDKNQSPVIHRAITRVDGDKSVNMTNARGYTALIEIKERIPSMSYNVWITVWEPSGELKVEKIKIEDSVDRNTLITWGDNNKAPDQVSNKLSPPISDPIKPDWFVGVSRGEFPWIGLLSLGIRSIFFDSSDIRLEQAPWDCWFMFGLVIACILVAVVLIEILLPYLEKRKEKRKIE